MTTSDYINIGSAIGSLAVAYLTIGIARATRDSAQATRDQIRDSLRPYISASVASRVGQNALELTIKNIGRSSAKNLHLSLDREFFFNGQSSPEKNLQEYSAFKKLIAEFPPGASMSFLLGTGPAIFGNPDRCPSVFSIKSKYFHYGEAFEEDTLIDLGPLAMSLVPSDPIAEELKNIRKELIQILERRDNS